MPLALLHPMKTWGWGLTILVLPKKVNNWACSQDDAEPNLARCWGQRQSRALEAGAWKISAKQQREIARRTIVAFFRWHLKGESQFKDFLTGNYQPSDVYWTYQDAVRTPVDNVETPPVRVNHWGGQNTFTATPGELSVECHHVDCYFDDYLFNRKWSHYTTSLVSGTVSIPHDTNGTFLGWNNLPNDNQAVYTLPLPQPQDVSVFSHLSFRIATIMGQIPNHGLEITLTSDKDGKTKTSSAQTKDYQAIPYPYLRQGGKCGNNCDNQSALSGVRIPLEAFEVDLTHLVELRIAAPGAWWVAIDDIEFGN